MTGDDEFTRLTGPYRAELLAHCYRMLGSVQDAEDQLQETLIRAWRSFGQFEGRSSLRTWLYRIATNTCLRALETRQRRALPSGLGQPGDAPEGPMASPALEVPWLQPIPDALLNPESRTNIRLALIAALQYLPPRQRAVLILRDVLGWRAAEVAGLLGTSTVAANSALQRARAQLQQAGLAEDDIREPADPGDLALLNRYTKAFENADIAALTELLRNDAVLEMPPLPAWYAGRDHIGVFLGTHVLRAPGDFRLLPTQANGQPALAEYQRGPDGVYRAFGIQVLTIRTAGIKTICAFLDPALPAKFGFPPELSAP